MLNIVYKYLYIIYIIFSILYIILGVPSHIQPLYSEKEKRLLSDKDHTIQDRIQYRWKKVSQFETKCEQKRELRKILRESNNKLAYCKHIIPIVEKIN